MLVQVQLSLCM